MHSVLHAHCLVLEPVAVLPFSLSGQLSVLGFAFHSQARQCIRPNRVHHCFSYGLVIRLRLLSTPPLDDAVTFDYGQPVLLSDGDFHPTVGAPSQAHECVRLVARFGTRGSPAGRRVRDSEGGRAATPRTEPQSREISWRKAHFSLVAALRAVPKRRQVARTPRCPARTAIRSGQRCYQPLPQHSKLEPSLSNVKSPSR